MTEKDKIFRNIWCCAYQRRQQARIAEDWERYYGEHQTVLMCLKIAKWEKFDTEKSKHLKRWD